MRNAITQTVDAKSKIQHSISVIFLSRSFSQYLQVPKLLHGVGRVGDELPQEDLFVRVDRVRHDVKQLPRFRLELQFLREAREAKPRKERRARRYRYARASSHHCIIAGCTQRGGADGECRWHESAKRGYSVGVVPISLSGTCRYPLWQI